MRLEAAGYTNIGDTRQMNQDSYAIKVASTEIGDVAMVVVADGMGGLTAGELASATAVREFSRWFDEKLPMSLETMRNSVGGFERYVEGQWRGLAQEINLKVMRHGMHTQTSLGTTLTVMLAVGARYSIAHVGDSRAYEITDEGTRQLTTDQTWVQQQYEAGLMSAEEARVHSRRNVLLQCLGASREVDPQVIHGNLRSGATYLLCSDGLGHELTSAELAGWLAPRALEGACYVEGDFEDSFDQAAAIGLLDGMAKCAISRGEHDNITAVMLSVRGGR